MLSSGENGAAERAVHSLKGVAGTLGVTTVFNAAAKAEAAIQTGTGTESALKALATELTASIQAICAEIPDKRSQSDSDAAPVDLATAIENLSHLKGLLENDDGEAADFIVEIKPNLAGVLTKAELEKLIERVGDFDFEGALDSTSTILSRLRRLT